jgi:hypothetical protein
MKNGVFLCEVLNAIRPGAIRKIETSAMPFKQMENISNFLKGCRAFGVPEYDLFETVDLFEAKDLSVVLTCIFALSRTAQKNGWNGPSLGPKASNANIRNFSADQVKSDGGMTKMGMGSSGVMQRSEISTSGAGNITFGAKQSGFGKAGTKASTTPYTSSQPQSTSSNSRHVPPYSPPPPLPKPTASSSYLPVKATSSYGSSSSSSSYAPPNSGAANSGTNFEARGGGFGMDAELAKKQAMKYDVGKEGEARRWIEEVSGLGLISGEFGDALKDGIVLCQLLNKIKPNSIRKIETSKMPFKQMENISKFLKGCRSYGVPEYDLFETVDLFEAKDLGSVVTCIHALGRAAQKNNFNGPKLGAKLSDANARTYTAEQAKASKMMDGMTKMSMGSSATMQRSEITTSGAGNVTFGAKTAGTGDSGAVSKLSMGSAGTMQRSEVSTSGNGNICFGSKTAGTGDSGAVSKLSMGSAGTMQRSEVFTSGNGNITFGSKASQNAQAPAKQQLMARVQHAYAAQEGGELTLIKGGLITITENKDDPNGWWEGQDSNGLKGVFPHNYVGLI